VNAISEILYLLCELPVAHAVEFFRDRLAVLGYAHLNIVSHDRQHLLPKRSSLLRELRRSTVCDDDEPVYAQLCHLLRGVTTVAGCYDER